MHCLLRFAPSPGCARSAYAPLAAVGVAAAAAAVAGGGVVVADVAVVAAAVDAAVVDGRRGRPQGAFLKPLGSVYHCLQRRRPEMPLQKQVRPPLLL